MTGSTGRPDASTLEPRSIHEIKVDGQKLLVKIESAIEAGEWQSLVRLADEVTQLGLRGLYHASRQKAKNLSAFAMGDYREPEPR